MSGQGRLAGIGTLKIKASSKGLVEIFVKAHFFMDEKINNTYEQDFSCSWDVEADLQGNLTISKGGANITPISNNEASFQLVAVNYDKDKDIGTSGLSLSSSAPSTPRTSALVVARRVVARGIDRHNFGGRMDTPSRHDRPYVQTVPGDDRHPTARGKSDCYLN
jgi:hypothetical protein